MPEINLNIHGHCCTIVVGTRIENRLITLVSRTVKNNKIFIIYDSNVYALYGHSLSKLFKKNKVIELVIPSGEKSKSISELNKIYEYLLIHKISRSDLILAVGGGVISDLAGYAASTILRGVPFAIISTTLLGMVDAAVGGKTGINNKRGKNLIGTFYQPRFVINDLVYIATLPERQLLSGFAEILKYGGLIGKEMIDMIEIYFKSSEQYNNKYLMAIVVKAVEYKKSIVEIDEKEHGKRMVLNFGHTIGHALENSLNYNKLLHGEALILGLLSAVKMSMSINIKNSKNTERYLNLIKDFIQFVPYVSLDKEKILTALELDKKRRNSYLNFILLDRPGKPIIRNDINYKTIENSIDYMIDCYNKSGERNA